MTNGLLKGLLKGAMPRRRMIALSAAAVGSGLAAGPARATDFPTRPLRMFVAYGAGGANDVVARIFGKFLGEDLGQPVVVVNQPGAGGMVGAQAASKAPPDGYTLFMGAGAHALAPSLYKKLPYDIVKDFIPVGLVGRGGYVLSVNVDLPVASVGELIALGRKPGTNLNFVSSGVGAPPHLAGELFRSMTSANMTHVPYKSEPESLTDLMAGRAQLGFITVASAAPLIKAGRLRGLAVSASTRSAILPELATLIEIGLADFDVSTWWGVFVPAGTPSDVVAKLETALAKIVVLPDYVKLLGAQGLEAPGPGTSKEFGDFVQREKIRYGKITAAAGIEPQD